MRNLAGKVVRLVVVLLLVTFVSFFMMNLLPGDPVTNFTVGANTAQRDQIRKDLRLDRPLPERYVSWLKDFATGNLGKYYNLGGKNPAEVVKQGLPISLTLMIYVQLLALLIAIPLGVVCAYKADSLFDRSSALLGFIALSVPSFIFAFFFKQWFAIDLGWFPVRGWTSVADSIPDHIRSAVLPTVVLALGQVAVYQRLLRSDMIATLQEDFITMAKAKGIAPRRVLFRHALRPSSLTLLTVAGLNVGTLIGGALIIEVIFGIPGIGTAIYEAIAAREYVALQSFVAIVAIIYVLVNFMVDFLYTVLDPGSEMSDLDVATDTVVMGDDPVDEVPTSSKRGIGALGWVAIIWLVLVLLVAIFGPLLAADSNPSIDRDGCGDGSGLPIYDPIKCADIDNRFVHVLGLDGSGRDVLSQLIFGARTSMIIAGTSVAAAMVVGAVFGMLAGYFGKFTGSVIGSVFDVMLAFPQLVLALTIVTFLGASESTRVRAIILALAIVATPVLGRITRASALSWSNREFVTASKALGARNLRIMAREVFPNVLPALSSIAFLAVAVVIVAEGGLSILGLGVPSNQVSWGQVLATGGGDLTNLSNMVYSASAVILLTVMALNLLGDAIRRKFDVRESML